MTRREENLRQKINQYGYRMKYKDGCYVVKERDADNQILFHTLKEVEKWLECKQEELEKFISIIDEIRDIVIFPVCTDKCKQMFLEKVKEKGISRNLKYLNRVFDEESLREDEYMLSDLIENDEIEIIETKETGFPDRQFEESENDYEETYYLGKYGEKYLSWRDEFIDGIESDYQLKVFDSFEEAKSYFDCLERYPSAHEIADTFNKSHKPYRLEVRYNHFNLYCGNCLIAEYIDLNSKMENVLQDAINQFKEFSNKVSKNNLYLCGIYKERDRNDNQRYYTFDFEDEVENGMEKELKIHIPSVYQHCMRVSVNFINDNYFKSWLIKSRNN